MSSGSSATPSLGTTLRVMRESRALSLEELAQSAGLTKGYLSKIERNLAEPSTATLVKLSASLGISVGQLHDTTSHHDVIRRTERARIHLGGEGIEEELLTPLIERRVQVIHSVLAPGGGSGKEDYSLPSDVEFALVLSGRLELQIGEKVQTLEEGDSITFSSQEPHSFNNPDASKPAEVLWVLSPALPDELQVTPTS